ncbi:lipoprotein [Muribaculum intestinale]|uniref:lipoprotein n=1 Tax=Muribaculum intestinale TaxID=1796646 RepID=UPI0025AA19AB|nr:lipoprotein [Muribaculum intestinale]
MKKYIITLALAAAMLTGCTSPKLAAVSDNERGEISWNAFCDARGYDRADNTYSAVNEYLDTWCGSVEEETALIEAGVEPY